MELICNYFIIYISHFIWIILIWYFPFSLYFTLHLPYYQNTYKPTSTFHPFNYNDSTPKGLTDVSAYPMLFAELMGNGWSIEDLTKLAGQNLLRVMDAVERVSLQQKQANVKPYEEIPNFRTDDIFNCSTNS